MNRDCDDIPDVFFDVTVYLPVTVRYWAQTEEEAKALFKDAQLTIFGRDIHSYSVGFPQEMSVKQVEQVPVE